jgi:diadenosine tetraphosphate (Ap4A) HIT family hydrolase
MSEGNFVLDPRLAAESIVIGDLALCNVRIFNDAQFPWLVLVPRRAGAVEIIDLKRADRVLLMEEIARASEVLKGLTRCHKLNVGALGNVVRQLHIHIIARFERDAAGTNPVWGRVHAPYEPGAREAFAKKLRSAFGFA